MKHNDDQINQQKEPKVLLPQLQSKNLKSEPDCGGITWKLFDPINSCLSYHHSFGYQWQIVLPKEVIKGLTRQQKGQKEITLLPRYAFIII